MTGRIAMAKAVSAWITTGMTLAAMLAGSSMTMNSCLAAEAPQSDEREIVHPELTASDVGPWMDGFMAEALPRGDIAGAVVVVVTDGGIILQRGFGYADVAARRSMDPQRTLVRAGSISKLFVWTAVMQLVESGKLGLDQDVNTYLDFEIPSRFDRSITLRDLMTHTPGFEEVFPEIFVKSPKDLRPLGQYLSRWIPERIYPPGRVPAYSNYGAALAGYIVQRVSGEPFETYVERHIFEPLRMTHSTFLEPLPTAFRSNMSNGYSRASAPPGEFELVLGPAGALTTTAEDMAVFMIAHLQQGQFGSSQLLRPESASLMHAVSRTGIPPLNGMALGFWQADRNGHRALAHGGDTALFHSYLILFPDDRVGLFVSFNSAGRDGEAVLLRSSLVQAFADRYFPAPIPDEPTVATAKAHARIISGYYETTRRTESSWPALLNPFKQSKVAVLPDGTVTYGTGVNGQPKIWHEIAPFLWREVGGRERLAVAMDRGRVVLLARESTSPAIAGQPVFGLRSAASVLPLLVGAVVVLAMTVVSWPVIALVRRRLDRPLSLSGHRLLAHRLVRALALVVLCLLGAWMGALLLDSSGVSPGEATSSEMSVLRIGGLLFIVGTTIAVWNALLVLKNDPSRAAKLWSVLLLVAFASITGLALRYGLIGFVTNY